MSICRCQFFEFDVQEEFQEAIHGLARPSENQVDTGQLQRTMSDPSLGHSCLNCSRQVSICGPTAKGKAFSVFLAQPRSGETASSARFGKAAKWCATEMCYRGKEMVCYRGEERSWPMSQLMLQRPAPEYRHKSTQLDTRRHERVHQEDAEATTVEERNRVESKAEEVLEAEAMTKEDRDRVERKAEEISDSPDATEEDRRAPVRECPGCNSDFFRSSCVEEGNLRIRLKCSACGETFCAPNSSEQRALLGQKFGVPCGKAFIESFDQIAEGDLLEMTDPDSFLQLFASHALCVSKNDSAETLRVVAFRRTSLFRGKVTEEEVSLSYLLERRCSVFRFLPLDCLPVTSSIAKARDSFSKSGTNGKRVTEKLILRNFSW